MSNNQQLELIPCPFCGGKAAWGEGEQKTKYGNEQVYCIDCWAITAPEGTKAEAAENWNSRASVAAPQGDGSLFAAKLLGFAEGDRITLCEPCLRQAMANNLVVWVETGELADDRTTLEIATAMKFGEWLASSWTAATPSTPTNRHCPRCDHLMYRGTSVYERCSNCTYQEAVASSRSHGVDVSVASQAAEEIDRLLDSIEHFARALLKQQDPVATATGTAMIADGILSNVAALRLKYISPVGENHAKNPDAFCLTCNEHPCKLIGG